MEEYLKLAVLEAQEGLKNNDGGPFGAVIIKDGRIVSKAHNCVLKENDSTAHAEVMAIRKASQELKTYDLTGCIIISSSEPCPMCLSAIVWSNIKEVYYGTTKDEVGKIGFRDDLIYEFLKGNNELLNLKHLDNKESQELLNDYQNIIY